MAQANIEIGSNEHPFGPHEEAAIISLAFSAPEFFSSVGQYLDIDFFHIPSVKFVLSIVKMLFDEHEVVPTRGMVRDIALRQLTVDDDYQEILDVIDRDLDPRDAPMIKETLIGWAREKAYGLLYSKDALSAYDRGDFDSITEIVENAQRIVDVSSSGMEFFKTYEDIFVVDTEVKLTTGFKDLDRFINEGGPTKGDVFVWMAPTGIGKCVHPESRIIEEKLSAIYEIETDEGKISLLGMQKVLTNVGTKLVADLQENDEIIELPSDRPDPKDMLTL